MRLSVAPGGHIDLLDSERWLDSGPSIPRGPPAAGIALVGCLASHGVTVTFMARSSGAAVRCMRLSWLPVQP